MRDPRRRGKRFPKMNVDVDQLILELGGGYKISDSFEVLFGGRWRLE